MQRCSRSDADIAPDVDVSVKTKRDPRRDAAALANPEPTADGTCSEQDDVTLDRDAPGDPASPYAIARRTNTAAGELREERGAS
jgi:hypothetical protein